MISRSKYNFNRNIEAYLWENCEVSQEDRNVLEYKSTNKEIRTK